MSTIRSTHFRIRDHDCWGLSCDDGDPCVVYAPTLSTALLVTKSSFDTLHSGRIPTRINERLQTRIHASSRRAILPIAPSNNAFHLGIGLTRNCTLLCEYCHADANRPIVADERTLTAGIEYAFRKAADTPRKTLSASFAVGGEPTMPWHLFKKTVSLLRNGEFSDEMGVQKVFLSMTTNGYYGDKKRQFIGENLDHLTLSCDGNPEIHNLHRPNRHGRPTYAVVAESIKYFLSKRPRVKVGIRATVSDKSVKLLPHIVRHFAAEFGTGIAVAFEPLIQLGRAAECEMIGTPPIAEFTEFFLAARAVAKELGVRVISSGLSLSRLISRYCGAMSIPSFALCVDGAVTACHRDQDGSDYGYGRIEADTQKIMLSADRVRQIRNLSDIPPQCDTCFAKWNCAGDCPDLRRIGWSRCEFNRRLLFQEIVEATSATKGGDPNGTSMA